VYRKQEGERWREVEIEMYWKKKKSVLREEKCALESEKVMYFF
jgi:hypothetical protein